MNSEFNRITQDPSVMAGRACIRGMCITISMIFSQIGSGQTIESLLDDFSLLEREDILQAIRYGSWLASGRELKLRSVWNSPPQA